MFLIPIFWGILNLIYTYFFFLVSFLCYYYVIRFFVIFVISICFVDWVAVTRHFFKKKY